MGDCYVYYRIDAAHEAEARRALEAMLVALQSAGVIGKVYRKTLEPLLWMEVYIDVADADRLVDTLTGLAEAHGLTACLAENQRRHVEHFSPLSLTDP